MADPPTYEESASDYGHRAEGKHDRKGPQRLSIREEVGLSRSQHVSALISKLLPEVRDRAQRGLSKSRMLLLPSDQENGRSGELVGFPEDEMPIIIHLEGRIDTVEFWMQQEALDQLQSEVIAAVSNDLPNPPEQPALVQRTASSKGSFLSKKQSKAARKPEECIPTRPSVAVQARFDETYFRSENAFGLYETKRCKCVLLSIDVR